MPFVLSNMRAAFFLSVALSLPALADECTDDYAECKDGCLIEFGGSMQLSQKKKYEKCTNKCTKTARRCSERVMETKNNQLDEGALDGTPASDETDRDGLPTRSGSKKKKARDAEESSGSPSDEGSSTPRGALREDEVPKSNRTTLKVDESAPPPKKDEEAPKKDEEDAPQKSEVIEMKITRKKNGSDNELRDDGPRAQPQPKEEEAPPPSRKKKKEKTDDAPPPKRDEDHDDLRNF